MHWWRLYVWFFSGVIVLSGLGRVFLFFKKREAVSALDLFEGLLGPCAIPALFGFAYQRPHGSAAVWKIFSVIFIVLSIYQFFTPKMKKVYAKGWAATLGIVGLQGLLGTPALWALVCYAFLDPAVWG